VTESSFGTSASSLTLRKRNKLIVAFSRGVLVAQSSAKGGAMNAYRFAIEQRKPVATFLTDGSADASGNSNIPEYENALVLQSEPEAFERWLQVLSSST
jgi:predicted Rossmann fold nucleotide-binding protein DprA/Smf involved in DNA uptake